MPALSLARLHALVAGQQRRRGTVTASRTGTRVRSLVAMTLLEIMIVLAILALVMGFLVGPRVFRALSSSKTEITKNIVKKLAFEAYSEWSMKMSNNGKCPTVADLSEYMNSKDTKDAWGEEYIIKCGGDLPAGVQGGIAVMSKGEDKKEGTGDDIKSWD
jgi:type II secretory pathway pseudopilin PulG